MLKVNKNFFLRKGLLVASIFCLSFLMSCHIYKVKSLDASTTTGPNAQGFSIISSKCLGCHSADGDPNAFANFSDPMNLTYLTTASGGISGTRFIIPGEPDNSLIYQRITATGIDRMPKGAAPLSASEIATIKAWIESLN
jgi:mono/diheme cytochrome c family protein